MRLTAFLLPLALLAPSAHASPPVEFDALVLPFKEVVVSSPVQSTLTAIPFKEGDTVKIGQTLAQLYNRIEELDMLRARAALEKREFDDRSAARLFAEQIISEDEAMKNRIELELARLQYEQAAELHRQRTILAPIDGLIVEKNREIGETVTASQPLFRLIDLSRVYIQFYVRAEDASQIHLGQQLDIRCPVIDPARVFRGPVDFIDPRVDAASGLLRMRVLLDNTENTIKPGLRALVQLPPTS